jgi:predicted component of type VI protein secretion system
MNRLLPRVDWESGLVLRPAHFRALEGALASETIARGELLGWPGYGLLELEWGGDPSAEGVVALEKLCWLTESGEALQLGGNATIEGPVSLAAAGQPTVDVFLHRLDRVEVRESYASERAPGDNIRGSLRALALSTRSVLTGASQAPLRLGTFHRGPQRWSYDPRSAPPLLSAKRTPFLRQSFADLREEVDRLERSLFDGELAPEQRGEERLTRQRVRLALRCAGAMLADVFEGDIDPHPYELFSSMRELSFELEALGSFPAMTREALRYRHRAPGECFGTLIDYLNSQLTTPVTAANLVRFDCVEHERGPLFVARRLPEELFSPECDVFVLVQRSQRDLPPIASRLELTTPARVDLTATNRATAVELELQRNTDVTRRFARWVDVFLAKVNANAGAVNEDAAQVWSEATSQRALALTPSALPQESSVFLFWQRASRSRG